MATKKCKCGLNFSFNEKDKEYYLEKGFPEPKRCPRCRAIRKGKYPSNRSKYDSGIHNSSILEFNDEVITIPTFIGAKFTNFISEESMFKGILRINELDYYQSSFIEVKLFYKELIDRMTVEHEQFAISNTGFKNYNGVYLNVLYPYNELNKCKEYISNILDGIYKTYSTFPNHFSGDKDYVNDEIWIDIKNHRIYTFGEDNIRKIYSAIMEEDLNKLSAKLRKAYTSDIVNIDNVLNICCPINIFNIAYPEDSRSLIIELIEREKNFRGLIL